MSDYTGCGIGSKIYNQYMKDLKEAGIEHIFSETIIDPIQTLHHLLSVKSSLSKMAGTRYEKI